MTTPYKWDIDHDRAGETFITGPHGTVCMVHREDDAEMIRRAPEMFYENQRLRAVLEEIACWYQPDNMLWWQQRARAALNGGPDNG